MGESNDHDGRRLDAIEQASLALEVARKLTERTLAGDVDGVAALYHQDAVCWRNFDDRELAKPQVLKVIRLLAQSVRDLRYDELRVQATPLGFVQQHVLRGIAPSGQELRVAACLVVTLSGGQILRLDEYLDSKALAPLLS